MMKLAERKEGTLIYKALDHLREYELLVEAIAQDLNVPIARVEKLILNIKRRH